MTPHPLAETYLQAVEEQLARSARPTSERAAILAQLREQIAALCAAELAAGRPLSDERVAALLDRLDAPESFGPATTHAPAPPAETPATDLSHRSRGDTPARPRVLILAAAFFLCALLLALFDLVGWIEQTYQADDAAFVTKVFEGERVISSSYTTNPAPNYRSVTGQTRLLSGYEFDGFQPALVCGLLAGVVALSLWAGAWRPRSRRALLALSPAIMAAAWATVQYAVVAARPGQETSYDSVLINTRDLSSNPKITPAPDNPNRTTREYRIPATKTLAVASPKPGFVFVLFSLWAGAFLSWLGFRQVSAESRLRPRASA